MRTAEPGNIAETAQGKIYPVGVLDPASGQIVSLQIMTHNGDRLKAREFVEVGNEKLLHAYLGKPGKRILVHISVDPKHELTAAHTDRADVGKIGIGQLLTVRLAEDPAHTQLKHRSVERHLFRRHELAPPGVVCRAVAYDPTLTDKGKRNGARNIGAKGDLLTRRKYIVIAAV